MNSYSAKYKDARWQKRRAEILARDNFTCKMCGMHADETEHGELLHVHHISYIKGRDPWDYEDRFLMTVCEGCHGKAPDITAMIMSWMFSDIGKHSAEDVVRMLTGDRRCAVNFVLSVLMDYGHRSEAGAILVAAVGTKMQVDNKGRFPVYSSDVSWERNETKEKSKSGWKG